MFSDKKVVDIKEFDIKLKQALSDNDHKYELRIQKLVSDQEIALKEKDFEIKHFESEKVKTLNDKVVQLEKDLAVQKQKNEMLDKLTDLNADVIDVKDLVKNLISKLPEIKINSLTTTCGSSNPSK